LTQTVNKASSSTALASSVNPSVFGQSVTFTATVSAVAPGVGTPTGTVTFKDGSTVLGTGTLSLGVATYSTSALSVASHSITAVYGYDSNFTGSTSSAVTQVVNKANSSTALVSSLNPSVYSQSITFTATVSAVAPGAGTPTGTVTFKDGSTTLGTGTLSGGVATYLTSALTGGPHSITAVYGSDDSFNGSTSSPVAQTVNKAGTTTGLVSSINPSVFGQSVTFTATVTSTAGTPTGTVTFKDGVATLGTGTLSSGVATYSTSTLSVADHNITAVYGSDTNFDVSTSPIVTQTVNKASTKTAVVSSVNPSVFGQQVTFTATVTAVAPGAGTPTGTVTFKDGATTIGTGTLSGGVATFVTSALSVAAHSITADYGSDANFDVSSSSTLSTLTQTVNQANTTTAVASSLNPSSYGSPVTFTATVTAVAPGSGIPTGTVQFNIDGTNVGGAVSLVSGQATYVISTLTVPGSAHMIKATYSGSNSFIGSNGLLAGGQTVNPIITSTSLVGPPPGTVVYGDNVTITAKLDSSAGPIKGKVKFSLGSTFEGYEDLGPGGLAAGGTISHTFAVLNNIGATGFTAEFVPDPTPNNHLGSASASSAVTVKPRNAFPFDPGDGAYTGQLYAWTPTQTSNSTSMTLGATIIDNSSTTTDIRTAKISFGFRNQLTGVITPVTGATNLAVGLVDPNNTKTGTSAVTLQLSVSSSDICTAYTVVVMVGGNYAMDTPTWWDTDVSICRATAGSIVTNPSAKFSNVGSNGQLAPDAAGANTVGSKRSWVDFNVKYNKSGTNPQGKVNLTVNSNRNSSGVIDGNKHQYVFTSNAISTLNVTGFKADFSAKANVTEYVLDSTGAVISTVALDTGAIMQMTVDGTPGANTVAIQINKSKVNGGIWYSSQWNGATTVSKPLVTGNIVVQ
jgi:hypothetical protein